MNMPFPEAGPGAPGDTRRWGADAGGRALVLDLVPDGVFAVDPVSTCLVYVNVAACRMLGYSAEELVGMPARQVRPEVPDAERRAQMADLAARPGLDHRLTDIRLRRKDGTVIPCEAHVAAVVDGQARPVLVYITRNVGERLALTERLRVSEASFRTAFEQAPVGVELLRLAPDGTRTILRANRALGDLLGEPVEALVGADPEAFTRPEDLEADRDTAARLASGALDRVCQVHAYRRRDGGTVWAEVRACRVDLPDEEGPLALVHLVDVTARVTALEKLELSERSFRTLFEGAPIAALIARAGADGTREIVLANSAASRFLGEPLEDLTAGILPRFTVPEDVPAVTQDICDVAEGRTTEVSGLRRFVRPDGTVRWGEVRAIPVTLPDVPGPLMLGHVVDVTERHLAQVRQTQVSAVHRFIARMVTDVLAGQELAVTYRQVVDAVAALFDADEAALVLVDPETGGLDVAAAVGPVATAMADGRLPAATEAIRWSLSRASEGLMLPDPLPGLPSEHRALFGPAISTVFPGGAGQAQGLLSAGRAPGRDPFAAEEVAMLTALAQQVALAVQLGQCQFEQRRQAQARDEHLARLDEAIRPLSEPTAVQRAACRLIAERLDVDLAFYAEVEEEQVAVVHGVRRDGNGLTSHRARVIGRAALEHFRAGRMFVVHDTVTDRRLTEPERQAEPWGDAAATIAVPLVKAGRWIAAFGVRSTTPRTWSDLEVRLVQDTAERTWAAAERSLAERASADERARRLQAEKELVERAARERRERLEQEFITHAAHELRTPLTGILGAVDALEAGARDDPVQRDRFLAHLRREATRLSRLSDALLQLAQAQSVGPLPRESFPVHALLESVAAGLDVAGPVEVTVEAAPDLFLQANPGLTEVLVGNLGANAARYTRAGTVVLAGYRRSGHVVIEVRDTGVGMDEQTLRRARDRFYRHGSARSSTGAAGFGLGLSIAAQAAGALGAEFRIDSTLGAGTVARVSFPPPPDRPGGPQDPGGPPDPGDDPAPGGAG